MKNKYSLAIGMVTLAVLLVALCIPVNRVQAADPATTGVNAQIDFATTTTCPNCKATGVTWQALPTTKTILTVGGHYYVPEGGMKISKPYNANAKGKYCIHLNGQSLSASGQVLSVSSNSEVHFFGSGTVTGNTDKTADLKGAVASIGTAKLYLHGGTYTTAGEGNVIYVATNKTEYASYAQLHLYDGATISGGKVTSADLGGNVHVEIGTFTVHGGTISGGQAKTGGNVYTTANGSFTMSGGTITGGKATVDGGNVYLRKGATLSGGSVTNGTAGNMGGNLLLRSATYKLSGVNVSGGKAASGGNIMLYGSAIVTMSAGKVEQGKGTYSGGNFYMGNNDAKLTLTGGTVSGGNAPKGGNVYVHLGVLNVNGGTVQNGTGTSGGNVYLRTNMNMQSGTITGGSATNGGNIYMYSAAAEKDEDGKVITPAETNNAVLTVSGGTISKGSATASGGNLYSSSYSGNAFTVTMSGGSFEGGSADNGGSVYLTYTKMNMSAGTISGGKASTAGNVYAATGARFTMTGGTVTAGQGGSETDSSGKGGNFYLSSLNSKVTIKNGTVSNGSATDLGGNICVNNGNLTITGGTVSGGQSLDGGNIYNYAGTNKQAYETNNTTVGDDAADEYPAPVITGGVASGKGGNILNDGRFVLGNCTISDGVATKYGAQFYLDTSTKLIVRADYAGECMLYMPSALQPNPLYGSKVANFTGEGLFPGKLILGNLTGDPLLVGKANDTGLYISSAALVDKNNNYTWYADNATMMADYDAQQVAYVQPASGEFPLSGQTVLVDLSNQNVSFTGSGKVTCYDSANDYYHHCGSATFAEGVELQNAPLTQLNGKSYYALNENGTWSFRRMELKLNSVSLRPGTGGIYYTGQWICDSHLQQFVKGFGVVVSVADMPGADFATEADQDNMWTEFTPAEFESGATRTGAIIERIVKDTNDGADAERIGKNAEYAKMPIYAVAYVLLEDGCYVSEGAAYSLHDVLSIIDSNINQYSGYAKTMQAFMNHWSQYGLTGDDWEFSFSVSEDIRQLNALYNGRNPYHGEMHNHADTGGTSDGKITLDRWIEGMEKLDMDFATIVDHKQSLHMQLPEWTNDIFVGGSELSVNVTDSGGKGNFHYNMIFSNVEDFEKVLFAFPELDYKQDATTGEWHFTYPKMTRARMEEVIAAIRANNGQFVHVHPKYDKYLTSDDPLVYWFADYTGLEITTGTGGNMMAKDNQEGYELWTQLLALGKKVYATAGSDNHAMPNTAALTSMYSTAKDAEAHLDNMRTGNFTAGSVGIRMAVGNTIMGGETAFDEQRLMVSVGDFHKSAVYADHTYKVEIYQDDQVVHTASVDPNETFYYAMDADKDASFYRVVVWDETVGARIAVGNPIWNIK